MDYITILGLLAGTLTTISFIPQVVKVWRTKSTRDISLLMFIILVTGAFLWLLYGILLRSLPIILANSVGLVLLMIILILKIRYK